MPWKPGPNVERKIFPMFSRWKTARTPGIFDAGAASIAATRPLAMVAPTGTAWSMPGKWKSEAYWALPLTFSGPSTRGVSRPIGDVAILLSSGDQLEAAVASAWVRQRFASSILKAFSLWGRAF